MEMILFIGGQGAGKTTFYRERFFDTYVRVSLDLLKTRHREQLLIAACLAMKQRFVVDNTNPTAHERARYFAAAQGSHCRVLGYYFEATAAELLQRNAQRQGRAQIPAPGVLGTLQRLEPPEYGEGFAELYRVRVADGGFEVMRIAHPG